MSHYLNGFSESFRAAPPFEPFWSCPDPPAAAPDGPFLSARFVACLVKNEVNVKIKDGQ